MDAAARATRHSPQANELAWRSRRPARRVRGGRRCQGHKAQPAGQRVGLTESSSGRSGLELERRYHYDLRGSKNASELTMRVYHRHGPGDGPMPKKRGDATGKTARGSKWKGTVLKQSEVAACQLPCGTWKDRPPRYKPCVFWDIRCEVDLPVPPEDDFGPFDEALIDCGIALEQSIRTEFPEF